MSGFLAKLTGARDGTVIRELPNVSDGTTDAPKAPVKLPEEQDWPWREMARGLLNMVFLFLVALWTWGDVNPANVQNYDGDEYGDLLFAILSLLFAFSLTKWFTLQRVLAMRCWAKAERGNALALVLHLLFLVCFAIGGAYLCRLAGGWRPFGLRTDVGHFLFACGIGAMTGGFGGNPVLGMLAALFLFFGSEQGWECYHTMGRGNFCATSQIRYGMFDWLLGKPTLVGTHAWSTFRLGARDWSGMFLRGLVWFVPVGVLLQSALNSQKPTVTMGLRAVLKSFKFRFAGWCPPTTILVGGLMPLMYELGWDIPTSAGNFGAGTNQAEFIWGFAVYWIYAVLIIGHDQSRAQQEQNARRINPPWPCCRGDGAYQEYEEITDMETDFTDNNGEYNYEKASASVLRKRKRQKGCECEKNLTFVVFGVMAYVLDILMVAVWLVSIPTLAIVSLQTFFD